MATEKYIDLVINRLTQAQYDEKLKNGEIYEEQIYNIIDHDDLFYYKTQLYTKDEIETKLSGVLSTLRGEIANEKDTLTEAINGNTTQISGLRTDLVSTNNTLSATTSSLNTFKTTVATTYATKQQLEEFSPVRANITPDGTEEILDYIEIDGENFRVYPEGEIEFDSAVSTATGAQILGSIKIGSDIWNIGSGDMSNYYTKSEVDKKVADAVSNGEIDLSNYYTKKEVDNAIRDVDVSSQLTSYAKTADVYTKAQIDSKGFLTSHQSLAGYATESYVNTKVADLVKSAPDALNTLTELASALGNDPNFATTITNQLSLKANASDVYTKGEVDAAIAGADIDLSGYYTKEEIDSKDFTNVSANPETTGTETQLNSISIKGVNYILPVDESENSLILSDKPVEGASNLASITIDGDTWNIVGTGGIDEEAFAAALQDYYTKAEVATEINKEVNKLINAAPETYDTFKEIANYIESDLSNTTAMLSDIARKANSSDVYSKSESNARYALKSDIPAPTDLSNYYTKDETVSVIDTITGLDNYYDKGEIDTKVQTINSNISTKQNTLVSGENIKTINGVSIMGVGNILINEGGSGGTPVEANPALDGTELDLTAISINNVNYAIPAGDMVFSEEVVQDQKTLKTIVIDGDIWSIEKGSTLLANYPLTGDEAPLESVKIDDTVYTLKGEEMLFYENEIEGAVPLKTIVINGDPWYVGGMTEEKVDAKINTRINALVNSAPNTLDTLGELAEALQENSSVVETLNSAISNKADKTEIIKSYNDLTDKPTIPNIVFGETEPTNPTRGMIWLKPL